MCRTPFRSRRREVKERMVVIPGSSYGRYGIVERERP
jgi:hypothetical protein